VGGLGVETRVSDGIIEVLNAHKRVTKLVTRRVGQRGSNA
jgi:hypothetical protein